MPVTPPVGLPPNVSALRRTPSPRSRPLRPSPLAGGNTTPETLEEEQKSTHGKKSRSPSGSPEGSPVLGYPQLSGESSYVRNRTQSAVAVEQITRSDEIGKPDEWTGSTRPLKEEREKGRSSFKLFRLNRSQNMHSSEVIVDNQSQKKTTLRSSPLAGSIIISETPEKQVENTHGEKSRSPSGSPEGSPVLGYPQLSGESNYRRNRTQSAVAVEQIARPGEIGKPDEWTGSTRPMKEAREKGRSSFKFFRLNRSQSVRDSKGVLNNQSHRKTTLISSPLVASTTIPEKPQRQAENAHGEKSQSPSGSPEISPVLGSLGLPGESSYVRNRTQSAVAVEQITGSEEIGKPDEWRVSAAPLKEARQKERSSFKLFRLSRSQSVRSSEGVLNNQSHKKTAFRSSPLAGSITIPETPGKQDESTHGEKSQSLPGSPEGSPVLGSLQLPGESNYTRDRARSAVVGEQITRPGEIVAPYSPTGSHAQLRGAKLKGHGSFRFFRKNRSQTMQISQRISRDHTHQTTTGSGSLRSTINKNSSKTSLESARPDEPDETQSKGQDPSREASLQPQQELQTKYMEKIDRMAPGVHAGLQRARASSTPSAPAPRTRSYSRLGMRKRGTFRKQKGPATAGAQKLVPTPAQAHYNIFSISSRVSTAVYEVASDNCNKFATALYDFTPIMTGEISLRAKSRVWVAREKTRLGWAMGRNENGDFGRFPRSHVSFEGG